MGCNHRFYGHIEHLEGEKGLLPSWDISTLIIGTFNPDMQFHPDNIAEYFYGRTRNYLWKILPKFCGLEAIPHSDVDAQIAFLKNYRIGLTDLLISIKDADIDNDLHRKRIQSVLDSEIEVFNCFTWNTQNIISLLKLGQTKAVYFTKLGMRYAGDLRVDTFEFQIRLIERVCECEGIQCHRLFTPSGNGLGVGKPKVNHLINRWYKENGGDKFPFLSKTFKVEDFPYS